MNRKYSSALGAGLAGVAAGGVLLLGSGAAFAAQQTGPTTQVPWEADPATAAPHANLAFYDSAGNQITSGTNFNNLFAYAAATTPFDKSCATNAALAFAGPQNGSTPDKFPVQSAQTGGATQDRSGTSSLLTSAPADIQAESVTYPVTDTHAGGANLNTFLQFAPPATQSGYANVVQVRLTDSGSRCSVPTGYWDADIAYNTGSTQITVDGVNVPAGSWVEIYPAVLNPASVVLSAPTSGSTANLSVNVSDGGTPLAGFVQFNDNGTPVGTLQTLDSNGNASYAAPFSGNDTYSATFIPLVGDEVGTNTTAPATEAIYPQSNSNQVQDGPSGALPESPLTVLLPASAIGVGGAAVLFGRRRRSRAQA